MNELNKERRKMPLSANTLIHFTSAKNNLKTILEENFRVFNCKETVRLKDNEAVYYVPMVSFCDIPLSEIKDHISKYGNYGIGLTKEWGARNGLNPVLYVQQNSMLANSYREAFMTYIGNSNKNIFSNEQKALTDILRYIKNYEGDLTRKETTIPKYRFSDEREWRYVPHYSEQCEMITPEKAYLKKKDTTDEKLADLKLEFEPNDIKYIIINDDSEIAEFIEHLRRAKGKKYTFHDIERLTTRILTAEQIKVDM